MRHSRDRAALVRTGGRAMVRAMNGYFDCNATTPLHPAAREAWGEAAERWWQNPSGLFREAGAARRRLEDAREQLADMIGAEPEEIVFLSGATEANNAVLTHAAAAGGVLAVSAIEHPSVMEPAWEVARRRGKGADTDSTDGAGEVRELPCDPLGRVEVAAVRELLGRERVALVSVMAANNETGVLQPWREIRAMCEAAGVPFHCDAVQWLGKCELSGLGGCGFVTGSAHKLGGPKGVGFLKVPSGGRPLRWLRGGPQEDRRRAGTENVPGVVAMLAALEAAEAAGPGDPSGRDAFEAAVSAAVPGVRIIAADAERLWNTSLLTVPGPPNVKWLARLSASGFAVSTGSACSRGGGSSAVLQAMGMPDAALGQVLRCSGGREHTTADWLALAEAFAAVADGMPGSPLR